MDSPTTLLLSEEMLGEGWGASGKAVALGHLQDSAQRGKAKAALYECAKAATLEKISTQELTEVVHEAGCKGSLPDFASALSDIFWMLHLVCDNQPDPSAAKQALASIVKTAVSSEWVTAEVLKARCEPELLEAADVVVSAGEFNKRVVKVKTQLMFTQKKFNLLREESEGYSKIIAELCQGKSGITPESAGATFQRIQALIGYFDLDPNRCFDLILEAYEQNLSAPGYLSLVELFNPSQECVCQIIGFKFRQCASNGSDTAAPKSLYRLAAMMVAKGLLRIEDVYPHLCPTDPEARENEAARRKWMEQKAKDIGVVSLSDNPKSKTDENPEPPELPNQKLGLLEGLLDEGDLENAERLFRRIAFMRPASHERVAKGLSTHLREVFEPLYEQTPIAQMLRKATPNAKAAKREARRKAAAAAAASADSDAEAPSHWDVLEQKAMPLLKYLGCHVGQDVILYTQICRTVFHLFSTEKKNAKAAGDTGGEEGQKLLQRATAIVMEMVRVALMPGLTLITSNPGVSAELWGILELLDYTARFEIYGDMKTDGLVKTPELVLAKALTNDRTKKVTKRISNDTFKQRGRELGKLSHSNPIVVFERIIETVKMMPNIISALVDSLRYISPLAFDVLTYLLVEGLSDPDRSRLKSDGQNLAEWLVALSEMAGSVCRRYQYIELAAIVKYVSMQMISGNCHDLVVLRKIVTTMSGVEAVEDLTTAQLIGQTGGPTLRNETNITSDIAKKATHKAVRRLKDSLVANELAAPLIILTGQQCSSSIYNAEFRQIKLIGEVTDKVQETLHQLVTFLSESLKPDSKDKTNTAASAGGPYADMLPSLQELVQTHKIEPAVAFYILRPVLEHKCGGMGGVVKAVQEIMPESMWTLLSPKLFATFWALSLYDIDPPLHVYGEQISKLRDEKDKIERDRSLREKEISKRLKEKSEIIRKLTAEKSAQSERRDEITKRLKAEALTWVKPVGTQAQQTQQGDGLNMFVQACIFPRVLFSQLDAVFCAKFVLKMHEFKTPQFSVLLYYDKIIKLLAPALNCCSGNEARRLGRFLGETLSQLQHWRSEPSVYRRECQSFPGFKKTFTDVKSPPVSYIDFVRVNHKWHVRLLKLFLNGLKKADTEIRNSLIMLRGCVEHFPAIKKHYVQIEKVVQSMESDDRQDLKMMALAYRAQLKKREAAMITDEQFKKEPPKPKPKPKPAAPPAPPTASVEAGGAFKPPPTKPPPVVGKDSKAPAPAPTADAAKRNGKDKDKIKAEDDQGTGGKRKRDRDRDRDRERERDRDRDKAGVHEKDADSRRRPSASPPPADSSDKDGRTGLGTARSSGFDRDSHRDRDSRPENREGGAGVRQQEREPKRPRGKGVDEQDHDGDAGTSKGNGSGAGKGSKGKGPRSSAGDKRRERDAEQPEGGADTDTDAKRPRRGNGAAGSKGAREEGGGNGQGRGPASLRLGTRDGDKGRDDNGDSGKSDGGAGGGGRDREQRSSGGRGGRGGRGGGRGARGGDGGRGGGGGRRDRTGGRR